MATTTEAPALSGVAQHRWAAPLPRLQRLDLGVDGGVQERVLVYDGGCPFCRHFALASELRGGVPGLRLVDGRADGALRASLAARGLCLARGAVLLEGERAWHGAAAITHLCSLMRPSAPLLGLLRRLFLDPARGRGLYPLLLGARRLALAIRGLPVDPDAP